MMFILERFYCTKIVSLFYLEMKSYCYLIVVNNKNNKFSPLLVRHYCKIEMSLKLLIGFAYWYDCLIKRFVAFTVQGQVSRDDERYLLIAIEKGQKSDCFLLFQCV